MTLLLPAVLLACGTTSEPIGPPVASPAPTEAAPAPAPPPAAPPHGPKPAAPPSIGVFQGKLLEQHVVDGTAFLRLQGCDDTLWVATDEAATWSTGTTLVTLGGEERPAAIPAVSGTPTVRFVARIAPALAPLDCTPEGRSGFPHLGKVLQSHVAAGYVYAEVAYCDRVGWIAGPEAVLRKGELVGHADGTPQRNFVSKSLQRRFDEITFVPTLEAVAGSELTCGEPEGG